MNYSDIVKRNFHIFCYFMNKTTYITYLCSFYLSIAHLKIHSPCICSDDGKTKESLNIQITK